MKKLFMLIVFMNVTSLLYAMEQVQSTKTSLGNSADWAVIQDGDQQLPESPKVAISYPAQEEQSKNQDDENENSYRPLLDSGLLPDDATVQDSLAGKSSKTSTKTSIGSSIYEWYMSSSKNVSNSFNTNKSVRYTTYAGLCATVTLGIAGPVLYLKK